MFHGRERVTAELAGRVEQCLIGVSCVVVTGASGAGKSSLVRAGLLPAIAAGQLAIPGSTDWPHLVITPTASPLTELATHLAALAGADAVSVRRELEEHPDEAHLLARQAVLARGAALPDGVREVVRTHGRLIVVVDQFEELFMLTASRDSTQRNQQPFITALLSIATAPPGATMPAGVVVIVVRGDFLDRCAAHPSLVPVLQDGGFIVGPMTEAELRRTITGPARAAGLELENGLADDILAELRARSVNGEFSVGALPLLSHAMLLTWQNREGHRLTRRSYAATGGVDRAVQVSADEVYENLTHAQQGIARDIFRRMTLIARDGQVGRRQVSLAELYPHRAASPGRDHETATVLSAFAARRLVVLAEATVEIAHDTLLHAWPRLRSWLEDDQAGRILYSQLIADATEWDTHGREPSFLYRGARLATVRSARGAWSIDPDRYPAVPDNAEQFLQRAHRNHTRATWSRRSALIGLVLLLIATATSAGLAVNAGQQATRQRTIAISRQLAAESQTIATTDPTRSRLLAAAAWSIDANVETKTSMYAALLNPALRILTGHHYDVGSVSFSPDGTTLATGSVDGTARLWDVATGKLTTTLDGGHNVVFSPNGTTLATTGVGGAILLWNVATGKLVATLTAHTSSVNSVAFSPDGTTLATGGQDHTVRLWDVATGKSTATLHDADAVTSVAFSPNGTTLATGSRTVRLWDVATGKPLATLNGGDLVNSVAFSPNGTTLAASGVGGAVRLWDVATRKQTTTFHGSADAVKSVAFSPNGTILAAASRDNTARLWDVATGKVVTTLTAHTSSVNSVAFSPDGDTLATASSDHTARLWDVSTGKPARTLHGSADAVNSVAFSPNGKTLATGGYDNTARLWDVATGKPLANLTGHTFFVNAVAFSPDGTTLATASSDHTARLWDAATGMPLAILSGHTGPVNTLAFSPDGKTLATAGADMTARWWDVATGKSMATLTGHDAGVSSMAFSPDGKTLAAADADGRDWGVRLWDVASRRSLATTIPGHPDPVNSVAFSPDGRTLATASSDHTVRLWDLATGKSTATLTGHRGAVRSVAFSPDGTTLATASEDHTARLWDLATGGPAVTLTGHTDPVNSVAFSPDGTTLATASSDHTTRFWQITWFKHPYDSLCARAGRPLGPDEWTASVPDLPSRRICK
ncbi:MAG TPA: AAA family ATPase [Candidatus Limnocylindrales bacterium]